MTGTPSENPENLQERIRAQTAANRYARLLEDARKKLLEKIRKS